MLIEAARRAEAAAREMLALLKAGDASCAEMRQMMEVSKVTVAIVSVAQTTAAASIAGRERHGDGGAEVLASGAGLSRQEARSQVKTAEALRDTPELRDALESGRVSGANARRLAEAAGRGPAQPMLRMTGTCWLRPSRCVPSSSPRRLAVGRWSVRVTAARASMPASGLGAVCACGTATMGWCICAASSTR